MSEAPLQLSCLLIDDDEADAAFFKRCLGVVSEWKVSLDVAQDFDSGKERIEASDYDLVFVDYIVGYRRGTDFISLIRESRPGLPMVMITGEGSEDLASKSRRSGAADYLPKCKLDSTMISESISYVMDGVKEQRQVMDALASATTDKHTGFLRKEYLIQRLAEEVSRFKRYGSPLSLLFVDIDNLKQVNDCKGHLEGDELIKDIACQIKSMLRDTDICGRFGGDEFVVTLPYTSEQAAHAIATRICRNIASLTGTTLSIGVAQCDKQLSGPNELLALADARVYQAKKAGRNAVASTVVENLQRT